MVAGFFFYTQLLNGERERWLSEVEILVWGVFNCVKSPYLEK